MSTKIRVLFVCLGNICRSPTAEAVLRQLAERNGVSVVCDSAGTSGNHDGELADPRTRAAAARHGVQIAHVSRRVRVSDFANFDWLVAMDAANARELRRLAPDDNARAQVIMLRAFEPQADSLEVPDPWYSGEFDRVFAICERACAGLLRALHTKSMHSAGSETSSERVGR
jgi:protein-tyrosine phosphatase